MRYKTDTPVDGIVQLLHNPRCSKSREALSWLKTNKIAFDEVNYLTDPLNAATLKLLSKKLRLPIKSMIRHGEPEAKAINLTLTSDHDDEFVYDYVAHNPKILERPIVIWKERAAIGRPLNNVAALFGREVEHVSKT